SVSGEQTACAAKRATSVEREEDLHRPGATQVVRRAEGVPVVVEPEAMGDDGRDVDLAGAGEVGVVAHGMRAPAGPLLDAEGGRADQVDLLEVVRRPLEAARRVDPRDDDGGAWPGDPHRDLEALRRPDGIVDDAHPARAVQHRETAGALDR